MDIDRDPTDQGAPRVLSAEDLEAMAEAERERRRAARRAEEAPSTAPPASERVIERAYATAGFARTGRVARLLRRCPTCGSGPRLWCRGKLGYLHNGR